MLSVCFFLCVYVHIGMRQRSKPQRRSKSYVAGIVILIRLTNERHNLYCMTKIIHNKENTMAGMRKKHKLFFLYFRTKLACCVTIIICSLHHKSWAGSGSKLLYYCTGLHLIHPLSARLEQWLVFHFIQLTHDSWGILRHFWWSMWWTDAETWDIFLRR